MVVKFLGQQQQGPPVFIVFHGSAIHRNLPPSDGASEYGHCGYSRNMKTRKPATAAAMTYSNHLPDGHPQEQEQLGASFGFFFMANLSVQQPQEPLEQEPVEQEPPRPSFFSELTAKPPLLLPPPQPQPEDLM